MGTQKRTKKSRIFSLLSNQRRRYALHACKVAETPVDVSEIAERVASWEYNKERDKLTSEERKRVYTAMQQTHLPAMEDTGVIEYDRNGVKLTEKAEELEVYMDIVPENSLPWGYYYLGLSIISALVLAGAWIGIYPESVPDMFWAYLVLAAFGVSSAFHAYRSRRMRLGESEKPPEEW